MACTAGRGGPEGQVESHDLNEHKHHATEDDLQNGMHAGWAHHQLSVAGEQHGTLHSQMFETNKLNKKSATRRQDRPCPPRQIEHMNPGILSQQPPTTARHWRTGIKRVVRPPIRMLQAMCKRQAKPLLHVKTTTVNHALNPVKLSGHLRTPRILSPPPRAQKKQTVVPHQQPGMIRKEQDRSSLADSAA